MFYFAGLLISENKNW